MPIYRLQPVDTTDRSWRASTWRGTVIVRAVDEKQARNLALAAFISAVQHRPGVVAAPPPWRDELLVTCAQVTNTGYPEDGGGMVLHPSAGSRSPRH
jgi:hypothetical protein